LLSVIGAVHYGTAQVFSKSVPHFDAQERRQYLHQIMATFSTTGKDVVMVVERSGVHRAHKLDTTFAHYDGTLRFHFLPAHGTRPKTRNQFILILLIPHIIPESKRQAVGGLHHADNRLACLQGKPSCGLQGGY